MASGIDHSLQTGSVQGLSPGSTDSPETTLPAGKFGRFSASPLPSDQLKNHLVLQPPPEPGSQKALTAHSIESVEGEAILGTDPELMSVKELKNKTKAVGRNVKALEKGYQHVNRSSNKRSKKLNQQKSGLGGKEGKAAQKADNAKLKVSHFEQLHHDVIRYKIAEMPQDQEVTARTEGSQDKKTLKAATSYHKKHQQLSQLETKVGKKLEKARKQLHSDEKAIKAARKQDSRDIKKSVKEAKAQENKRRKALKKQEIKENKTLNKQRRAQNKQDTALHGTSKTNRTKKNASTQNSDKTESTSQQAIAQRTFDSLKRLINKAPSLQQVSKLKGQIKGNKLITSQQRSQLLGMLVQKQLTFAPDPPKRPPG